MDTDGPSGTALSAAVLRAAHLVLDAPPHIFVDELAMPLCGIQSTEAFHARLTALHDEAARVIGHAYAAAAFRAVRAAVLIRSRYTEDTVAAALAQGITQYVILGAGLDAFAYRRRDLLDRLHVFEVDYPATQQWKRERLRELGVAMPPQCTFVPMDFARETLMTVLHANGYRREQPAVFSCLGVSQYLPAAALHATLAQIAVAAPGSVLLFGYLVPETFLDDDNRRVRQLLNVFTAARGEPILTAYTPTEIGQQLQAFGWTEVSDLGVDTGLAHYTAGRTDGLQHPQTHRLVHAQLGASESR
jgi:methyltransferase (TIGR00027 family)